MIVQQKALVLVSGGMDSAVTLADAIDKGRKVSAVSFNYGQRHSKELETAKLLIAYYRSLNPDAVDQHYVLDLTGAAEAFKGSALTGGPEVPDGHYEHESMKQTVVPNRNMIMLSLAAGLAIANDIEEIRYGAHAGDHAIYPDCRPEFYSVVELAVNEGNYNQLHLEAPFIRVSKADIVRRGLELNVPFNLTWSCYKGADLHCGTCGTCTERREAFELADSTDPVEYR